MRFNDSVLVLADGEKFEGYLVGADLDGGIVSGELVFNTALSGYQEIITDPSYSGQIITFTYPQIGNYGISSEDSESRNPFCQGIVVRDLVKNYSNWRAQTGLHEFMVENQVSGIAGIDTRRLTKHLRTVGAIPGAFGRDEVLVVQAAASEPSTEGRDLVTGVTTPTPYTVGDPEAQFFVVAYDYGIKTTILRRLVAAGCRVEVVPSSTSAHDVLVRNPDGIFLSNGPGDPEAAPDAIANVQALLGERPIFGICLGHQILGLAAGAKKERLLFGHHGGNHPVRNEDTGRVEITSQNHNYAINVDSVSGAELTHVNLNDGGVEGFRLTKDNAFGIQHHPEAGPGPHDAAYLFQEFTNLMSNSTRGR